MDKGIFVYVIMFVSAAVILFNSKVDTPFSKFQQWKLQHNVKYSSKLEDIYREKVFIQNLAKISKHNSNPDRTYQMGLNQFSALTTEQFASQYLRARIPNQENVIVKSSYDDKFIGDIDWQSLGAVTKIKTQGNCGACWAFSTTGSIEGLYKIVNDKLVAFSEQQLIDCSGSKYGNQGCNGGWMSSAYKYIVDHGISPASDYPYQGIQQRCLNDTGKFRISGFTEIAGCDNLANALMERPLSVAVDATNWSPYKSGIFNNCKTSLNHGVLLTGMTNQYWRIKNTWGTGWGEQGYIRIARGNTCGVCIYGSYPYK